jgi:hypothetical protein
MSAFLFMLTAEGFNSSRTASIIFLFLLSVSLWSGRKCHHVRHCSRNASYRASRGTFHCVSAFLGKLGALVATIIVGYLTTEQMFWVCGGCAVAGGVCTYLFTVLDLSHVAITGWTWCPTPALASRNAGSISRHVESLGPPVELWNVDKKAWKVAITLIGCTS